MTAPSSLAFPGSRTLAGWWRHLAPLRPQALWVGHLFLHRVEALVACVSSQPLASLDRFVLQAVAAEQTERADGQAPADDMLPRLNARLHLGIGFLRQALRALADHQLVEAGAQDAWGLTQQGRAAMESGFFLQERQERRVFHFVETRYLSGGREPPQSAGPIPTQGTDAPRAAPHFVAMNGSAGVPCSVGDDWSFDIGLLKACVHQATAWKEQYGFPDDVREILGSIDQPSRTPPWRRVVVDRPERLPVLLILVAATGGDLGLHAFAVWQEGWHVQMSHPAFTLHGDWSASFPGLADKPSDTACRLAWRSWCQARGHLAEEVEACVLVPEGLHLHVKAPAAFVDRLRASRSDALKAEAWILVGDGALRAALLLDIKE